MPQKTIELLNKGQQACRSDKFRQGNLIVLPAEGSLIVTGDIHGHRRNFERIVSFADLENNHERHVILQEIIHGGVEDSQGGCLSHQLLFDVIRYKLSFPDQVHIIMGNHDTALITNSNVMKDGKEMNRAMRLALEREYKQSSGKVILSITQYLSSQPLAVKCGNGIWISHSLPANRYVSKFDKNIFERELQKEDFVKPGSVYLLTWGRKHSQQSLDKIAQMLGVDLFILGHQAQSKGYRLEGDNLIIISSDHNHGCLLPLDLSEKYTAEQLIKLIVPLASIP